MSFTPFQVRFETAATWESGNPVLEQGEPGYETDTGLSKLGDGVTAWNDLGYKEVNTWRLTADGSNIGPSITTFSTDMAFTMAPGGIYEFDWDLFYRKNTTGSVTFTIINTQAPVNLNVISYHSPVAGIGTQGSPTTTGILNSTATSAAITATGSLTNATNHRGNIIARVEAHATLASTMSLSITCSVGSITPFRGSSVTVKQLGKYNANFR